MEKITEKQIQNVLDCIALNNEESGRLLSTIYEEYSVLFNYLENSYSSVFNKGEQEYVEFGCFVILAAFHKVAKVELDLDELIVHDEDTLALIEKDKSFNLESHLNNLHDTIKQKDLLEFVIEYLYEEETEISNLSKDLMASFLLAIIQLAQILEEE